MVKCENYLRYFKRYTDKFFTEVSEEDKYKIELKIVHTMNVLKLMRRIAKEEGLQGEDYEIAKTIALFHDLGRFNQIKLYGTFSDKDSINHAEESVRELKRLNILDGAGDTYVSKANKELIYKAIINHNKNKDALDFDGDEKLALMSKLIRDCDKIDIYRSVEKHLVRKPMNEFMRAEGIKDPSLEISDDIFESVMNNENVSVSKKKTVGDHCAYYMNWISYDFNFNESYKALKEKGYYEKLWDTLVEQGKIQMDEKTTKMKEHFDEIMKEKTK